MSIGAARRPTAKLLRAQQLHYLLRCQLCHVDLNRKHIDYNSISRQHFFCSTRPFTSSPICNRSSLDLSNIEYGTKTIIKASPYAIDPSHPLSPYVWFNIQNPYYKNNPEEPTNESNMNSNPFDLTFLGTGAGGRANIKRGASSSIFRLPSGHSFLFDAGEGTQRQLSLLKHGGAVKDLCKIFITHLHADHVAGLLGIVLQKEMSTKNYIENGVPIQTETGRERLDIYGPVGLYNYLLMNLGLTYSGIKHLDIYIHELNDSRETEQTSGKQRRPWKNILCIKSFRELKQLAKKNNVVLNRTECQQDGTWILQKAQEIKENDVQSRNSDKRLSIKAAEVKHKSGVQTFGYVLEERKPPAKIDVEKAKALGIQPSVKYRSLKNGFSVMNDDETREVQPHEVIVEDGKKARKIAILGDTWSVPKPMQNICQNADLLVHEATLEKGFDSASRKRGHSTAKMAGEIANRVNAKVLIMNHISGRHDGQECVDELIECANGGCQEKSHVLVAYDFLNIHIPEKEGLLNR